MERENLRLRDQKFHNYNNNYDQISPENNNNCDNDQNNDGYDLQNASKEKNEIISKINNLNTHFDFFGFINGFFSQAEKDLISASYLVNPRFSSVFSNVEHLNYLYLMGYLNYQNDNGNVVNGIKETLRAIELKKAKLVYVAVDCEIQDYSDLIIKLCELNAIPYLKVLHWTNLRDVLFKGPTSLELEKIASSKGKPVKITPKCNSAVVLYTQEDLMLKSKQPAKNEPMADDRMDIY